MPRLLWLGLFACAACVLALLAFLRGNDAAVAVDPYAGRASGGSAQPDSGLLASAAGTEVERESVGSAPERTPSVASQESGAMPPAHAEYDFGPDEPMPPVFEDGVVEVRVVRDEDGGPIAGATVRLDVDSQADARGVCVFTGVSEGRLPVSASAPGRAPTSGTAQVARESPYAILELRLPVQRDVVVRLLDPLGRPFRPEDWGLDRKAAARIGIVLADPCGALGRPLDAGGAPTHHARSSGVEPCTWRVEIRGVGPACVHALLGDVIIGVAVLDPSAAELAVRLDVPAIEAAMAPVVFRVLDAQGDVPIAGALVELDGAAVADPTRRTGADGRVRIGFASAGTTQVVVTAPGHAPSRFALVRPFPPEIVTRMAPGRRITGRVVDQDGSPLSGARLRLPGAGSGVVTPVQSAKDGTFEFQDLASAEYQVQATYSASASSGGGMRVTVSADCREGDVLGLEIQLNVPRAAAPTPR